jgi:hypothetical protein
MPEKAAGHRRAAWRRPEEGRLDFDECTFRRKCCHQATTVCPANGMHSCHRSSTHFTLEVTGWIWAY